MRYWLLPFLLLFTASSTYSATLRDNYENCVSMAYLHLLVEGHSIGMLTAETAIHGCETELQALYSLLINTDMEPKMALSMVSSIRVTAKRNLLRRR